MVVLLMCLMLSLLIGLNNLIGLIFLSMMLVLFVVLMKHDFFLFLIYSGLVSDSVSFSLVLLSVWITLLMLLIMVFNEWKSYGIIEVVICLLMFFVVMVFLVFNFILFYIFFEACLIPTFILILGWGYQPERIQAGIYMLLYTVFSSLPLLIVLIFSGEWGSSSSMFSFLNFDCVSWCGWLFCVFGLLSFLVKLPVYFVHLWLPKAHVEAPVGGSMILAGILLKLGGYGIYRVLPFFFKIPVLILESIVVWGLWGGLLISLFCLSQVDIKCLIALSSVAHMSFVLGALMIHSIFGVMGSLLIMIGHGFCSSGLFCASYVMYVRCSSRSMGIMNSMKIFFPSIGLLWFFLVSSNMSAPLSLSLIGEILSIIVMGNWSYFIFPLLFFLVFFSAVYSLFLYEGSIHGGGASKMSSLVLLNMCEMNVLMMHWLPLNLLFLVSVDVFFY